jgi:hypothetical protein
MRKLYWMLSFDDEPRTPPGSPRQWAIVRAESEAEAHAKARQFGLSDQDNHLQCVSNEEDTPAAFTNRLLSPADVEELGRITTWACLLSPLKRMAREVAEIQDSLSVIAVRLQDAVASAA